MSALDDRGMEVVIMTVNIKHHYDGTVSYTHLRAHETDSYLVCRLLLEKKKKQTKHILKNASHANNEVNTKSLPKNVQNL